MLQKAGFTTEDQRSDNTAFEVEGATAERGGFIDHNGSAPDDTQAGVQVSTLTTLCRGNI
jgi:hypothetical protein